MQGSAYIATSVDGMIATSDGGVGFLDQYPPEDSNDDLGFSKFLSTIDVIIMGRKTFERVLSFNTWPYGDIKLVVCSRAAVQIPDRLRESVSFSNESPAELFQALSQAEHSHAYVDGGFTIHRFLEAGLIDSLTITTVPIILGDGVPLFSSLPRSIQLTHRETKVIPPHGLVMTTYTVCR
jgi:dihydrofolate reductase